MRERIILHCDVNNFYASVECVLNPELKKVPLAVAGDPRMRHGIILAKNYIAKQFGIYTGQTLYSAKKTCPDLVCLPPHFDVYHDFSQRIIEIYKRYTDRIQGMGLDECWLDVTHSCGLFGSGKEIADKLRDQVFREVGVTISVGVSFNKTFAKLGSDLKKPNATTVISRENFKQKIYSLPANSMLFIGKHTYEKLLKLNITTIGDLAEADETILRKHFGIIGSQLKAAACGEDTSEVTLVQDERIAKSVGNGLTCAKDLQSCNEVYALIRMLAEKVAYRARKQGLRGHTVNLTLRNSDLSFVTRSITLPFPTNTAHEISTAAQRLFENKFGKTQCLSVRAVRVALCNMSRFPGKSFQPDMFHSREEMRNKRLNLSLDNIREKYGYNAVRPAVTLKPDLLTGSDTEDELWPE